MLEASGGVAARLGELLKRDRVVQLGKIRMVLKIADNHDAPDRRNPLLNLGYSSSGLKGLAAIAVSVHGEQDLGLDLAQSIDDAVDAEVRRAR